MRRYVLLPVLLLGLTAFAQVPASSHVWIITLENTPYEDVIGNPAMPYLNGLAKQYALATQYYANVHNSLSALMWLVAGQTVTFARDSTQCFDVDNIVRELLPKAYTWRSYQEDLPYPGFLGLSFNGYFRRHNPLTNFIDTCAPNQILNSVPFTQLSADIAAHSTPNYVYITPNADHSNYTGTLAQADAWLSTNLPTILALPEFQPGGDGVLFITFDESVYTDMRCSSTASSPDCGGRVATVVVGPNVVPGTQSSALYRHENLLKTICVAMGLPVCPGNAQTALPMEDVFASGSTRGELIPEARIGPQRQFR